MDLEDHPISTPSPTSYILIVPKQNLLFLPASQWLSPGQFETNKKVKYNVFLNMPQFHLILLLIIRTTKD